MITIKIENCFNRRYLLYVNMKSFDFIFIFLLELMMHKLIDGNNVVIFLLLLNFYLFILYLYFFLVKFYTCTYFLLFIFLLISF